MAHTRETCSTSVQSSLRHVLFPLIKVPRAEPRSNALRSMLLVDACTGGWNSMRSYVALISLSKSANKTLTHR